MRTSDICTYPRPVRVAQRKGEPPLPKAPSPGFPQTQMAEGSGQGASLGAYSPPARALSLRFPGQPRQTQRGETEIPGRSDGHSASSVPLPPLQMFWFVAISSLARGWTRGFLSSDAPGTASQQRALRSCEWSHRGLCGSWPAASSPNPGTGVELGATEAGLGTPVSPPCCTSSCQAGAFPTSGSLWVGDANSPVIDLQEGEVCLGRDLPLLVLRGVGVLKREGKAKVGGTRRGLAPSGTMPTCRLYLGEAALAVWEPKLGKLEHSLPRTAGRGPGERLPLPLVPGQGQRSQCGPHPGARAASPRADMDRLQGTFHLRSRSSPHTHPTGRAGSAGVGTRPQDSQHVATGGKRISST